MGKKLSYFLSRPCLSFTLSELTFMEPLLPDRQCAKPGEEVGREDTS